MSQKAMTDFEEPSHKLTVEDIPRIFASLAVFGAAFGFGAGLGVLGPALPELAEQLSVEISVCGQVFSWRGIGALVGTSIAASVLEKDIRGLSKHMQVVIVILFSAVATFMIAVIAPQGNAVAFNIVKLLFFFQGMGFGAMDTMAIVAMQEMWGQRVQPWMQVRNLMSSGGAIVGPVSVSKYGFNIAFQVCAITCLSSLIGIGLETFYSFLDKKRRFGENFVAEELENLASNLEAIQEELEFDGGSILGSIGAIEMASVAAESEIGRDRVLSYATPQIREMLDQSVAQMLDVHIVPSHVSFIIGFFAFLHIGLLYTYGGWISTYTIMLDPSISFGDAAQMASLYSTFACVSAVYAIPLSLFFSTTAILRFQLSILLLGALTLFFPMDAITRNSASAVIMGLAVSCIYPLIMTLANDYKMTMDARGVFYLVMGGGLGESLAPALAGVVIARYGAYSFPAIATGAALVMIASYIYVHLALTYYQNQLSVPVLNADENRNLLDDEVDEVRARSTSKVMTRGWRSLSTDRYSGPVGLEMIVDGSAMQAIPENGTSHMSYQNA